MDLCRIPSLFDTVEGDGNFGVGKVVDRKYVQKIMGASKNQLVCDEISYTAHLEEHFIMYVGTEPKMDRSSSMEEHLEQILLM